MSAEEPPKRPRYQPIAFGGAIRSWAVAVYGLLSAGMAGFAFYMNAVEHQPLTSAYVAGPAIGALWFALRVFMVLGSRK